MLVRILQEGRDLLFFPRIERTAEDRAARSFDLLDQRRELFAVAPSGEYGKAFGSEFLRDLGADVIAGSDHGDAGVALLM